MKKLIGIWLVAIVLVACQASVDYKKVRDEVMSFHDEVMGDHGIIVNNQMKLDTLMNGLGELKTRFPELDTIKERKQMVMLKENLNRAEEDMNDWMHQFEPDVSGKSNEEAVAYFKKEKLRIAAIDSTYKAEIKRSSAYLNQFKR
ncbi:hypothetical protein [Pedobacter sp. GR22-6]|uniref:hypothetical protein n=1 Tax=Pedobacter sp. GR22-6 TaxID=3127957 RepID=UPI00307EF929